MSTDNTTAEGASFGLVAALAIILGVFVVGLGLLLLPTSLVGGGHIALIGLSLALSGLFSTEWAGDRWNISPAGRRNLSLAFAIVAAILVVLFVVVNFASFESAEFETGS